MNINQKFDDTLGLIFPYYTWTFLDVLKTWDVSTWDVFEYGVGYSTLWWKRKAKSVDGVDNQLEWATKFNSLHTTDK